ncbi:hypothetical protein [Actinophytocola sp. KF-1]
MNSLRAGPVSALPTERLTLRPWQVDDAAAALEVSGHPDVARWLSPVMDQVRDLATGTENTHAASVVRHNGMARAGETTKYLGLEPQVFRLRQADLDRGAPAARRPPHHDRPAGAR